jgi:membrane associated rhomboid family serine protease
MIPIGDDNSARVRTPVINYLLILTNILVFVYLQNIGTNEKVIASYSMIPGEILSGKDFTTEGLAVSPQPVYLTILSSMFMHGSIAHILGNMLYLWIFGDNLENVMGHFKYLLFYISCGILASMAHVWATDFFGRDLNIPCLGASGAIAGVLGGYLLLFPRNEVRVIFLRSILAVPAFVTLGLWIGLQLLGGAMDFSGSGEKGGVAYAAHIGGIFVGLLLVKFFTSGQTTQPEQ